MDIISLLRPLYSCVKPLLCRLKHYNYLKNSEPMSFTIVSKTEVGTQLFTTGSVVSINLFKVVIEGYQVNIPVSSQGRFQIMLSKISGINPHPEC